MIDMAWPPKRSTILGLVWPVFWLTYVAVMLFANPTVRLWAIPVYFAALVWWLIRDVRRIRARRRKDGPQ